MRNSSTQGQDRGRNRNRINQVDGSSRYLSDTASFLDSSSYQDASSQSQRESDQESLYLEEFRAPHRRFSSDSESESSSIIERSSSGFIDRFRQCEPRASIPRFQQSTAATRGRQREKSVENGGRSESRGPAGRQKRGESQEPGYRGPAGRQKRGESQEPGYRGRSTTRNDSQDRRGRSSSRGGWADSLRQSTDTLEQPRYRRSESQEPGLRAQSGSATANDGRGRSSSRSGWAQSLRQDTDSQQDSGRHKRSESQEPRRRRSESKEPVHGRHRRSESQGPARQYLGASTGNGFMKKYFTDPVVCQADPSFVDAAEERTIRAVHSQLKESLELTPPVGEIDATNLYDAMRSEVRKVVKTEIERSLEKDLVTLVKSQGTKPEVVDDVLPFEEEQVSQFDRTLSSLDSLPKSNSRIKFKAKEEKEYISKELNEEAQRFFEEFASISASEPEDLPPPEQHKARALVRTPNYSPEKTLREFQSAASAKEKSPKTLREASAKEKNDISPSVDKKASPAKESNSEKKGKGEGISRWKTGLVAVNTDGVVMPWLDWEPELDSPLLSDAMFSSGISKSYPCSTIGEVNWECLVSVIPKARDVDSIHSSDELFLQRIRFACRIEAGRLHLCKREF